MKNHLPLLVFWFLLTAAFYTACQKQDKPAEAPSPSTTEIAGLPYSKLLVIKDRKAENAVTMKVSAIHPSILDQYTETSFELKPVFEDAPAVAAQQTTEEAVTPSNDVAVTESFIVVDQQLQRNVLGYELTLAETPGKVEDRGWVTSALIGNSCARRMKINNWGPNINVQVHISQWCVNTWFLCCNYTQGCQITNYCNVWGGGIAAKISYWTPQRWSMTMYVNC